MIGENMKTWNKVGLFRPSEITKPYSGEDLRKLRAKKGVGPVRKINWDKVKALKGKKYGNIKNI